ncbi:MAG: hypothetical protein LBQ55_11560 [Treponema sp.]|nr:hypothetical protein [Treponema sp.]
MKKIYAWTFIAALIFTLAACGNPSGGGDGDGDPIFGRLTITNLPDGIKLCNLTVNSNPTITWDVANGNTYHPEDADWYESVIGQGMESGVNYYLSIARSAGAFNGENWYTHGEQGNFDYTDTFSVHFGLEDTSENLTYFGVNNVQFTNGYATLDWTAFSFTLPATDGEFKLTGAGAYNNKYAIVFGAATTTPPATVLYGFGDAVSATALKGFKIESGEVQIPIYSLTAGDTQFQSYSGNHTVESLVVVIMDTEDFDYTHYAAHSTEYKYILYANVGTDQRVTFASGKAEKAVSDGTPVGF